MSKRVQRVRTRTSDKKGTEQLQCTCQSSYNSPERRACLCLHNRWLAMISCQPASHWADLLEVFCRRVFVRRVAPRSHQGWDSLCYANLSDSYHMQSANGYCLFASFLLTRITLEIVNTYTVCHAGSTIAFSWTTYWQGFTRIVKYKGSTDADYTSKSNASQTSVLLTASG